MYAHLFVYLTIAAKKDDPESKRKGARSIAAYMQLSDAVFTPYVEGFYRKGWEDDRGGENKKGGDDNGEARSGEAWWGAHSGAGTGLHVRRKTSEQELEDEEVKRFV